MRGRGAVRVDAGAQCGGEAQRDRPRDALTNCLIVDANDRGAVIVDHVPEMVGGPKVAWAYNISYTKGLLARAMEEVKRPAGSFRPGL